MIRDDFGYPVYQDDNNAYDHRSRDPLILIETEAQGRFHDQHYNRFDNFPSHRSHQGRMYASSLPPHFDGRSYLDEGVDVVNEDPGGEDLTSGLNLATPIPTLRARKRVRLGSCEDPSFLPPLPGDTGDRFDLLSTYSGSAEMHSEHAMKRRRQGPRYSDGLARATYEAVGTLPHPGSFHSYDQDGDRRSWDEHPSSILHDHAFVDHYHPNHNFAGPIEHFQHFPPSGAGNYSHSTHQRLFSQRTASTDEETPDNDNDDLSPASNRIDQKSESTSATKTTGGESTSELKLLPSPKELEFLPNPRAREALYVWYQRLRELVAFKNEHGHSNVRQKYPPNPQLGIWVNKQRCTRSTLSRYKLEALEAVGFDWGTKKGEHAWQSKYDDLIKYKKIHHDCK